MSCTTRHTDIVNTTGAPLLSGNPTIMINGGNDKGLEVINRTIITAELGTGAGKTLDASGPAAGQPEGLLFAQFQGAAIQNVVSASVRKSVTPANNTFSSFSWGTDAKYGSLGFMVINTMQGNGLVVSSLYLRDLGDDPTTQIANGDRVIVLLEVSNIPTPPAGATTA